MLSKLRNEGFEVVFLSHAEAILRNDFPEAITEIEETLLSVEIPITEIIGSGGGEAKCTQRLRHSLADKGWHKTNFEIKKTINGIERESISHEVDHVRSFPNNQMVAMEIEWNNKDPFFDRDLENFKRLHAEGAISVGVIVTRGTSLQDGMYDMVRRFAIERKLTAWQDLDALGLRPTSPQQNAVNRRIARVREPATFAEAWANKFVSDKFGQATTHWRKLDARVRRGVGNPCPLLLIGLPASVVKFDAMAPMVVTEETDADSEA